MCPILQDSLKAPELRRGLEIQEQETQVHVARGKGFVCFLPHVKDSGWTWGGGICLLGGK